MSRRAKLIGLQAAVVAALVAVVYATLLAPESRDPLEGVEAPNGTTLDPDGPGGGEPRGEERGGPGGRVQEGPGGRDDVLVDADARRGTPDGPAEGRGLVALGGVVGAIAPGTAVPAFDAAELGSGEGDEGPPPADMPKDDQYEDAASALMSKVR